MPSSLHQPLCICRSLALRHLHFDDEGVGNGAENGLLAPDVFHLLEPQDLRDAEHLESEVVEGTAVLREHDAPERPRP